MKRILTLGEPLLRLTTAVGTRLENAQELAVHYGGAEANVTVNLAQLGHQVAYASKVPDNPLGKTLIKQLHNFQVDTQYVLTGGDRLGIYYLESGVGNRGASVVYDRKTSSFATMTEMEWNLDTLFMDVNLFHVTGITPALSEHWQQMVVTLVKEAKKRKITVSFDINYRAKLWNQKTASKILSEILPYVDYCSAAEKDALYLMDISLRNSSAKDDLNYYYQAIQDKYPNIGVFYATRREIFSASHHSLQGFLWYNNQLYSSSTYDLTAIVDRVGGGDAFAAGILHGLLSQHPPDDVVEFATAASTLKHTLKGDINLFSENEVKAFIQNQSGVINR